MEACGLFPRKCMRSVFEKQTSSFWFTFFEHCQVNKENVLFNQSLVHLKCIVFGMNNKKKGNSDIYIRNFVWIHFGKC